MTTNRMGLEQTLSDERLELFIRQPLDNGLTRGEQMELVREALARRKASKEPVAWKKRGMYDAGKWDSVDPEFVKSPDGWHSDYDPLYAAPPLQDVKVPDGWIKCIDRMPDVGDIVLTSKDGCVNVGEMERSGANYRYFTSVISGRELPATHWMPLPTAPESVTNEP